MRSLPKSNYRVALDAAMTPVFAFGNLMKTSILGLLLTLAAATALAEPPSRTYSNIVINVVTSTNAVTFTDLRGHTYSNVTVKLIPYGLAWYATNGFEGRLAITNLDEVTLADITGLSSNQVAYLIYKKAMEDAIYIPQEVTNRTPWWLEPYPHRLKEGFVAKPGIPPPMYFPTMYDLNGGLNDSRALQDSPKWSGFQEMPGGAMQAMPVRAMQEMQNQVMRSFPAGPPASTRH
jgi:hypothetical protein